MKEITLKGNGKKSISNNPLQFYIRNPYKNEQHSKKNNALQFDKRNLSKTEQTQKIKNGNFSQKGLSSWMKFESRFLVRFQKNPP